MSLFKLEAQQRGMPDLRYIVVPHPIGGIQHDAVVEKARGSLTGLLAAFAPEPVAIAGGDR